MSPQVFQTSLSLIFFRHTTHHAPRTSFITFIARLSLCYIAFLPAIVHTFHRATQIPKTRELVRSVSLPCKPDPNLTSASTLLASLNFHTTTMAIMYPVRSVLFSRELVTEFLLILQSVKLCCFTFLSRTLTVPKLMQSSRLTLLTFCHLPKTTVLQ